MSDFPNVAFLGAGQIAEALIRGVLKADLLKPNQIHAVDIRAERLSYLRESLDVNVTGSYPDALESARLLFVTVKPQDIDVLLKEIATLVQPTQTLVSVAAGVSIARIESLLGRPLPVVRVMPNTPCLVGEGMAAVARGSHATDADVAAVAHLFSMVGKSVAVDERYLDAVTGLSGSGPAFISLIVEALSDAGVRVGLPRDVASLLAAQTTLGTARMLLETGTHPAQLKDMVSSPGGTTIAGLHALERGRLRATLIEAVVAATERSRELSNE